MTRKEVLAAAEDCVCKSREQDYGDVENSFAAIADFWADYLTAKGLPVSILPHDVACMMALLKIARVATGRFKLDSYVDCCGYMACGGELESKENQDA